MSFFRKEVMSSYKLTHHLRVRLAERNVSLEQVEETLALGQCVPSRPSSVNPNYMNCSVYSRQFGSEFVRVVVDNLRHRVVTVTRNSRPY